jgi:hypothetical protein
MYSFDIEMMLLVPFFDTVRSKFLVDVLFTFRQAHVCRLGIQSDADLKERVCVSGLKE